jgi:hypothetical protein
MNATDGPRVVCIAGTRTGNSARTRAEADNLIDVLTSTGHGAEVLASVNGKVTVIETHPAKEDAR